MRKPLLVVLAVLVVAGAIGLGLAQRSTGPAVRTTEEVITVPGGVTSLGSVSIDTTLYVPASATAANPARMRVSVFRACSYQIEPYPEFLR